MEKAIEVFSDGGATGNPGPAASSFVVIQNGNIIQKSVKKIGHSTNNIAEYEAVIFALEWLRDNQEKFNDLEKINFYLDSLLVVNQLNGFYKIKNSRLKMLVLKIKGLEQGLKKKIVYRHIRREKNKLADSLVKSALMS